MASAFQSQFENSSNPIGPGRTQAHFLVRQDDSLPVIPVRVTYNSRQHEIAAEVPDGQGRLHINNSFWLRAKESLSASDLVPVDQQAFEAAVRDFAVTIGQNIRSFPANGGLGPSCES